MNRLVGFFGSDQRDTSVPLVKGTCFHQQNTMETGTSTRLRRCVSMKLFEDEPLSARIFINSFAIP